MDLLIPNGNGGFTAQGSTAARFLQSGLDPNALRTLAVLRKDEWLEIDRAVIKIAQDRLIAAADLLNAGLRHDIVNGLGTTVFQYEDESDFTPAEVNMDAVTRGEQDRPAWTLKSLPLPIIHKDFKINLRALEASRRLGESLDVTSAAKASRVVSERVEDIVFNGVPNLTYAGASIEGYRTATGRNAVSFVAAAWNASAVTGLNIIADVLNMIQAAQGDRMFGPYNIYVGTASWVKLQDDFKANSDRTILERILAISGIASVKVADQMTADEVLMINMQRDTVMMVVGMQPTVLQWETEGGIVQNFKVMSIMIPRIAVDQDGKSGIVHLT